MDRPAERESPFERSVWRSAIAVIALVGSSACAELAPVERPSRNWGDMDRSSAEMEAFLAERFRHLDLEKGEVAFRLFANVEGWGIQELGARVRSDGQGRAWETRCGDKVLGCRRARLYGRSNRLPTSVAESVVELLQKKNEPLCEEARSDETSDSLMSSSFFTLDVRGVDQGPRTTECKGHLARKWQATRMELLGLLQDAEVDFRGTELARAPTRH